MINKIMNDSKAFGPSPTSCLAIDGSKIKSVREAKKLTQLYVATCLGVTVDTISRWENGRSPNIKLENAEKLAEVLELSLADIGESTDSETSSKTSPPRPPSQPRRKPWWPLIPVSLILLLSYFHISTPKDTANSITASRLLPQHASPSQPFPVLIRVQASTGRPVSFIVKETLPAGCQALRGEPVLMAPQQQSRTIKWLSSAEDEAPLYFAYLAQAPANLGDGQQLAFQGEVMVEGQSTNRLVIGGNNTLTTTNSHWADSNQDQRIDDEEILTIYNSFTVLQALGVNIEEIRQIWAGKGYRWDPDTDNFVVIP